MKFRVLVLIALLASPQAMRAQGPVLTARTGLTWSYEDLSDWLRRYPGMYVQDYGVLGAPTVIQPWGMAPWLTGARKDGISQSRVGDGLYDSNLQPPAELDSLDFQFGTDGVGRFSEWTRTIPSDSPYTELQIREGYYNFGSVDLAHGQQIYGRSAIELTGRLVWYDGLRQGVSDSRFNRLRGRYRFHLGRRIASTISYGGSSVQANSQIEARGARNEREEGALTLMQADSFRTALNPRLSCYIRRDRERWNSAFNARELVRGWQVSADADYRANRLTLMHEGSYADLRYPGIGDYTETTLDLRLDDRLVLGRVNLQATAEARRADVSFVASEAEFGWLSNARVEGDVALLQGVSLTAATGYHEHGAPSAWRGTRYRIADRPLLISREFSDLDRYYVARIDGHAPGGIDRLLNSSVGAKWMRGTAEFAVRLLTVDRRGAFSNQFVLRGDTVTLAYARGGDADHLGAASDFDMPVKFGVRVQGSCFTELDSREPARARELRGIGRVYFERDFLTAPLTLRSHLSYEHIGRRRAVSDIADQLLGPTHLVGFRLSATIHGVTLVWGADNLLAQHYYVIPGYLMIRKEEYLGVQWRLWL
ncbi:hypothetical protein HZB60_04940 [candidate division KSB1 bacterium]|nr:hypothetical protein [candidate division KSB1 bacterium]